MNKPESEMGDEDGDEDEDKNNFKEPKKINKHKKRICGHGEVLAIRNTNPASGTPNLVNGSNHKQKIPNIVVDDM